jgi:hypothetical protein
MGNGYIEKETGATQTATGDLASHHLASFGDGLHASIAKK